MVDFFKQSGVTVLPPSRTAGISAFRGERKSELPVGVHQVARPYGSRIDMPGEGCTVTLGNGEIGISAPTPAAEPKEDAPATTCATHTEKVAEVGPAEVGAYAGGPSGLAESAEGVSQDASSPADANAAGEGATKCAKTAEDSAAAQSLEP